ncbi:MAG: hypothetical protein IH840_14715 [Candidatus Heimdallarchaeota archaeon]|nr:hypothetical protein [Candidatus Heimdallarchaeota archaeon]
MNDKLKGYHHFFTNITIHMFNHLLLDVSAHQIITHVTSVEAASLDEMGLLSCSPITVSLLRTQKWGYKRLVFDVFCHW